MRTQVGWLFYYSTPPDPVKNGDGWPRRHQMNTMRDAELKALNLRYAIEYLGADERLTQAQIEMDKVSRLISDYIDDQIRKEEHGNP